MAVSLACIQLACAAFHLFGITETCPLVDMITVNNSIASSASFAVVIYTLFYQRINVGCWQLGSIV